MVDLSNITKAELEAIREESARRGLGDGGNGFTLEYLYMIRNGTRGVSKAVAPIISRVCPRYALEELLGVRETRKAACG